VLALFGFRGGRLALCNGKILSNFVDLLKPELIYERILINAFFYLFVVAEVCRFRTLSRELLWYDVLQTCWSFHGCCGLNGTVAVTVTQIFVVLGCEIEECGVVVTCLLFFIFVRVKTLLSVLRRTIADP
jgi:hypothetical protein